MSEFKEQRPIDKDKRDSQVEKYFIQKDIAINAFRGKSFRQIAFKHGMYTNNAQKLLSKWDSEDRFEFALLRETASLMFDKGKKVSQISKHLNVSRTIVSRLLDDSNRFTRPLLPKLEVSAPRARCEICSKYITKGKKCSCFTLCSVKSCKFYGDVELISPCYRLCGDHFYNWSKFVLKQNLPNYFKNQQWIVVFNKYCRLRSDL